MKIVLDHKLLDFKETKIITELNLYGREFLITLPSGKTESYLTRHVDIIKVVVK